MRELKKWGERAFFSPLMDKILRVVEVAADSFTQALSREIRKE